MHQTNLLQAVKVKNEVLTSDVRFFWAIQSCCALASSKYLIRNKWNLIQMPTVKSGLNSECIIILTVENYFQDQPAFFFPFTRKEFSQL